MFYNLSVFDEYVEKGLVRKVEDELLVLYNYTDQCVYERAWDDYTRIARGIIFEKTTGDIVAHPFPKFFNLGEMHETQMLNLPQTPYRVQEKVDGSLGIIFNYNGHWRVATRGSLSSEQAVKALELLHTKYNVEHLQPGLTYLVEIVYPENKIVVDYGKTEELVMLTAMYKDGTEELPEFVRLTASHTWMRPAKEYDYSIEKMIELQQTMPKDQEGFVVRFANGLRVKIKGAEYMRIHKMISCMSPLSFWESMVNGVVNKEYLAQLPEEYRNEFEPMVKELEAQYEQVTREIGVDYVNLPTVGTTKDDLRTVGIFLTTAHSLRHPSAVFPKLLNKQEALDKYIMKRIRPTGNAFKVLS